MMKISLQNMKFWFLIGYIWCITITYSAPTDEDSIKTKDNVTNSTIHYIDAEKNIDLKKMVAELTQELNKDTSGKDNIKNEAIEQSVETNIDKLKNNNSSLQKDKDSLNVTLPVEGQEKSVVSKITKTLLPATLPKVEKDYKIKTDDETTAPMNPPSNNISTVAFGISQAVYTNNKEASKDGSNVSPAINKSNKSPIPKPNDIEAEDDYTNSGESKVLPPKKEISDSPDFEIEENGGMSSSSYGQPRYPKPHSEISNDKSSHFFAYMLTLMVMAIFLYLLFHNKKRILALVLEGRSEKSRRRSTRARYHKLDNNLEEAMSNTKGSNTSLNQVY